MSTSVWWRGSDGTGRVRVGFRLLGAASAAVLTFGAAACSGANSLGTTAGASNPTIYAKAGQRDPSRTVRQLQRQGLTVHERARSFGTDCAANSYGQVRTWFRTNDCSALFRVLYDVSDGHGGKGVVAVAWVDMPTNSSAADLKSRLDQSGTGNLTELAREVRFTGQNYASVRDGVTTINAQAEPTGGTTWTIAPDTVAQDAVS